MASIHLTLPIPPSINTIWRRNPYSRGQYKIPAAKHYVDACHWDTKEYWNHFSGPVKMIVTFYFKTATRDIDSGLKVLLDALQPVYGDDGNVLELYVYKKRDKVNPHCDIYIEAL